VTSRSLAGSVVLVTGASSGMGRATAEVFAREGATVAVTDVRDVSPVVDGITAAGGTARGWRMDVRDDAEVLRVVDEVAAAQGGLDVVVNNAGVSRAVPIDDDGYLDTWHELLDVLLTGQLRVVRAALPHLRRAEHPRVINISSTEGLGATRGYSAYTAAKHGVVGLTRALAVELGPEGITVNAVCPGAVDTEMTAAIPAEAKATFARRRVALGRYAAP
jgi:3-oxoacyl-[acyl-carrier protein] reductase